MNVVNINPAPATFDDIKAIWPRKRRGCIPIALDKFSNLIAPGDWATTVKDHETGKMVEATYPQQDPTHLLEAAKQFVQSKCLPGQTYEEMWGGNPQLEDGGKFVQHISTWLNRGGFLE